MSDLYFLDGKTPVKCNDIEEWVVCFDRDKKHVALTEKDGIRVSTVFLGMDHAYDSNIPLLFETMIFGGKNDEDQWRYSTWDEAYAGHIEACKLAGV